VTIYGYDYRVLKPITTNFTRKSLKMGSLMLRRDARWVNHVGFLAACACLFAILCFAIPSYFPLMEPDSGGYVNFSSNRTALYPLFLRALSSLGLSLQAITYVQVAIFCGGLMVLLSALERARIKRVWIVLFVVLLGANSYFASFQRTILTESISFTTIAIATAFLLDYLRTGRALWIALAGLFLGLTIGIRPAGVFLLPMIVLAAWLKWYQRNVSIVVLILAAALPPTLGVAAERLMHRIEHGTRAESVLPYVLAGKAAMLVKSDTVFTGPAAESLNSLGQKLYRSYKPAHEFLRELPSWVARPVLTAFYEAAGQFQVINKDIVRISDQTGISQDYLREELGKQAILSNLSGYLKLTLTHYIGQWSITALTFPPAARAVSNYCASVAEIPLYKEIGPTPFYPRASWASAITYPAFALAGMITLILSFFLLRYLWEPKAADNPRHQYLMMAAFFAVTCHSSMLLISFINVSTPRFLMAVYPHILLSALFLLGVLRPAWIEMPTLGQSSER
jgi:hypothetical protein